MAKVATWISGVALVVLLIACANVANLFLARALRRRRGIALRLALGVSHARLLSQLFTESVLLALLGGVAGILIAQWGGGALRAEFLAKTATASVVGDSRTLIFAGLVALGVGLVTGLAPVLQARRVNLSADLKAGSREGINHRSAARVALLVAQGALSLVLLVGAGLFVRSLQNVRSMRLGYDVDPVLLVGTDLRGVPLDNAQKVALRLRLLDAAKAIPGVESAALNTSVPFYSTWDINLHVAGIDSVGRLGEFTLSAVTPEYFSTIGTHLLRGRGITAQDTRDAPGAMVVSEGMARTLWPAKDPIGQCVKLNADTVPCTYVVGVAENVVASDISGDQGDRAFFYYLSTPQFHPDQGYLFVRVHGTAADHQEAVRRRLQKEMPGASYVTVTPFGEIVAGETSSWKMGATMFVAFGALALLLAAIGLYSVIAYNVAQRTHELGVRIALGAQPRDVVRVVVSEGVRVGVAGIIVGGAIALFAARWVQPLLFHESPRDPAVFGVVIAVLFGASVVASLVPALRASRVDPNVALRAD